MSLKTTLAKALVYVVIEIGALMGVPMTPDKIEKLMKIADIKIQNAIRNEEGKR